MTKGLNEKACEILRGQGINAYEQAEEIVVYGCPAMWHNEVVRFSPIEIRGQTIQEIACNIAHKLAEMVAGPHTHD